MGCAGVNHVARPQWPADSMNGLPELFPTTEKPPVQYGTKPLLVI